MPHRWSPPLSLLDDIPIWHDFLVYELFSSVRIGEMFDVIGEFPDSLPAVQKLREAPEITQQYKQLAAALRYRRLQVMWGP